jgi:hypothetical protein
MRENRPLLGRDTSRRVLAHVQQSVLMDLIRARAPLTGPGAFAGMPSHAAPALERLGCVQVRGVRALADGKQVWRTWWRLPRSMWSPTGEWDLDLSDWPALGDAGTPPADVPKGTPGAARDVADVAALDLGSVEALRDVTEGGAR